MTPIEAPPVSRFRLVSKPLALVALSLASLAAGAQSAVDWVWVVPQSVGRVDTIAVSQDGRHLASSGQHAIVRVWDTQTGALVQVLTGHTRQINKVRFSPCGRHLASSSEDETVRIWDLATGLPIYVLPGHFKSALGLAYSPDGQFLAAGALDHRLRLWDTETGTIHRNWSGVSGSTLDLAWSPDGQRIASAGANNVSLWSVAHGTAPPMRGGNEPTSSVVFSPDGLTVAATSLDGTLRLWETLTRRQIVTIDAHDGGARSVAYSPDGTRIATGGADSQIRLWDADGHSLVRIISGHRSVVRSVVFTPDGTLASGSEDGSIRLWDAELGSETRVLPQLAANAGRAWLSADERTLLVSAALSPIQRWDVRTGTLIDTIPTDVGFQAGSAVSPDGRLLACVTAAGSMEVWDLRSRTRLWSTQGGGVVAEAITFSRDGRQIVFSVGTSVRCVEAATGNLIRFIGQPNFVRRLALFDGDRKLVTGHSDNRLRIWDVETRQLLRTLTGPTSYILAVTASPDGRVVASSGADWRVRLWDSQSGTPLRVLEGHSAAVSGLAFAPDGRILVSGSEDRILRFWDPQTGNLRHLKNARTGGVDWVTFTPDGRLMTLAGTVTGVAANPFDPWVAPTKATVQIGRAESGDFGSLARPDGNALRVARFVVPSLVGTAVSVEIEGSSPTLDPRSLAFRVYSRATHAGGYRKTLELWDWSASGGRGAWDPVDTLGDAVGTDWSALRLDATGDLGRYVRADGTLRARYRVRATTVSSPAWIHETDQAGWIAGS